MPKTKLPPQLAGESEASGELLWRWGESAITTEELAFQTSDEELFDKKDIVDPSAELGILEEWEGTEESLVEPSDMGDGPPADQEK